MRIERLVTIGSVWLTTMLCGVLIGVVQMVLAVLAAMSLKRPSSGDLLLFIPIWVAAVAVVLCFVLGPGRKNHALLMASACVAPFVVVLAALPNALAELAKPDTLGGSGHARVGVLAAAAIASLAGATWAEARTSRSSMAVQQGEPTAKRRRRRAPRASS